MKEEFKRSEERITDQEYHNLPENFEQAADMVIKKGDDLMAANHGPEGLDPKTYHTPENHIDRLQERAKEIADVFNLTREQRKLLAIAISYHDTIINYDAPDEASIAGMVMRHRGAREGDKPMGEHGNEALSAKMMLEAMERINQETGKTIFTADQMQIGQKAVDATYPGVELGPDFKGVEFIKDDLYEEIAAQNPRIAEMIAYLKENGITKGLHFFQPHLENPLKQGESMPEEVLIMSLVDLGAAGMVNNPEIFFEESDNEAKELYHNLRKSENIERLLNGDTSKDKEDRIKANGAMLGWFHSQPGFMMWQMIRFEKIMKWLRENRQIDEEKEKGLHSIFAHYETNIQAYTERDVRIKNEYDMLQSNQGEKIAFAYLAGEMRLRG